MRRKMDLLAGRIRALPGALEAAAARSVRAAAELAAGEARMRAPVDSGALRAGIGVQSGAGAEAAVRSAAPHAAPVEFGTSRMAAQPYLLPTAGAVREEFFAAARAEAQRAAREVWK